MGPASRVDKNQNEIVRILKMQKCSVQYLHGVGTGCPDLLVGIPTDSGGMNLLIEVKYGKGKLNKTQARWHSAWAGEVTVIRSFEQALALVRTVKRRDKKPPRQREPIPIS